MLNVHVQDKDGFTTLITASRSGLTEVVRELLRYDFAVEINKKNKNGRTALIAASPVGHVEIVRGLLKVESLNVNAQDKAGMGSQMLFVSC